MKEENNLNHWYGEMHELTGRAVLRGAGFTLALMCIIMVVMSIKQ